MFMTTTMKKVPTRKKKDPADEAADESARMRQRLFLGALELEAQIHDLRAECNIVNPHERGAHRHIAELIRSNVKSLRKEWAEK